MGGERGLLGLILLLGSGCVVDFNVQQSMALER